LLVQLKVFQTIGRFRRVTDIPAIVFEHVARQLRVEFGPAFVHPDRTLYRHRPAVLKRLGVTAWGTVAREIAQSTMIKTAKARTDPADIINAAVDALIRHRFELPALIALRRLAGTAHSKINAAQWGAVCARLDEAKQSALEALLVVDPTTQRSPFADLCRAPGRASRKNLKALIDRHHWLEELPDPTAALQSIADSKVLQWANEAMRLNALELREYVTPRRQTLLLALIRHARGQVLDDLTQMLLRLARKVEWKSQQRLEQWYADRHAETDSLIRAFHDSLIVHGSEGNPAEKAQRLEVLFAARGGRDQLTQDCAEHLRHEKQNWRPFARAALEPLRSALLRVTSMLPLQATATTRDLLSFVGAVSDEEPPYSDYYRIDGVALNALPREWRSLVHDDPEDGQAFNRRQLEVVAVLELATAIKAGEMFVCGSLSHDRFWDRLPAESADPAAISAYAAARGWQDGADGLVRSVKEALGRQAGFLDRALGNDSMGFMRRAKDGRPIVTPTHAVTTPPSAIDLEKQMMEHMPERAVLVAIANTENWTHWGRHFGLPSRLAPQIKDARRRYVLTTCIRLRPGSHGGRPPPQWHGLRRSTFLRGSAPRGHCRFTRGLRRSHQSVFPV
jgi:hypothetical protein